MKKTIFALLIPATAIALTGCVVTPMDAYSVNTPSYEARPDYPSPGAGWMWMQNPHRGWGWHHPNRGWHRGWR